mmetsp:Transcript_13818/g.20167  ORF Transcript_13818/g.20167 Transcript_13818/m.20167 type:complete len:82 (-) Transcript_13818:750-995(-)
MAGLSTHYKAVCVDGVDVRTLLFTTIYFVVENNKSSLKSLHDPKMTVYYWGPNLNKKGQNHQDNASLQGWSFRKKHAYIVT